MPRTQSGGSLLSRRIDAGEANQAQAVDVGTGVEGIRPVSALAFGPLDNSMHIGSAEFVLFGSRAGPKVDPEARALDLPGLIARVDRSYVQRPSLAQLSTSSDRETQTLRTMRQLRHPAGDR